MGPYQIRLSKYPFSGSEKHPRRFQASWFVQFGSWLEYSPSKDAAYCLPCYLFTMKTSQRSRWDDHCSCHNNAVKSCEDLLKQSQHIDKVMNAQSSEQILNNRLRVKTSIDVVRWLAFQGCAFRGHDETLDSKNRGNFLEMLKLLASYNDKVGKLVLENAPKSSKYTSPQIQKEILEVLAKKVRNKIRKDVGDSRFCIIVDEARDEFKREQMTIILRFVDVDGFIQERFFDLVHVKDTSALTLKNEISAVLSRHCLDIQNIRGQGYDGASNMRGEWNGLQALFLKDCPYAYYVHFAASREVVSVHEFFSNLNFIINVVGASCKRHDELQAAQATHIAHMIAIDELESGKGANQIGTTKRAGDSRWGSHFYSICSLLRMFEATYSVLETIIKEGSTYSQRGDANAAYKMITSFQFIFILHLMKEIMGITDVLCQVLQQKSQDILNAMNMVSTTKGLIQKLRNEGWENLLENVVSFSKKFDIDIPELSSRYIQGRGRHQRDHITIEHHYHFEIFNAVIDFQMQELDNRFALDPKDGYKSFNIDDICCLAEEYYPLDFSENEKINLSNPKFQDLRSIANLCRKLVETEKSKIYYLIDRLIRLILTLPVSTATSERAFSAMKIVKTRLRNKIEDEFLANNLVVYIEREIAKKFDLDSILDDFVCLKERKLQF
ncbi:hypothetical protein I3842_15G033100 [Carya illinoinensis]|uniref:TTF-type domain-containing protein n=1 Tax=Carya illinoinensis TaxID=32201 RepID=A0A922A3F0_CARIL|nr:hypothetical protein I3842_15G033100 [Carya illinoinensis]